MASAPSGGDRGAARAPVAGRILLAEDDTSLRSLLSSALRRDGHDIVEARDGFELVQRLADRRAPGPRASRSSFDLVISDLRMPGWSGLDVLAAMSRQVSVPPFVLITAFGDEQVHRRARELGAVATLDKPFDIDELRALVASTVATPSAVRNPPP